MRPLPVSLLMFALCCVTACNGSPKQERRSRPMMILEVHQPPDYQPSVVAIDPDPAIIAKTDGICRGLTSPL